MPLCPRCRHPAETAPTVCTQCGYPVPADNAGSAPTPSPKKLILAVVAVLLTAALIVLAISYLREVNQLVR